MIVIRKFLNATVVLTMLLNLSVISAAETDSEFTDPLTDPSPHLTIDPLEYLPTPTGLPRGGPDNDVDRPINFTNYTAFNEVDFEAAITVATTRAVYSTRLTGTTFSSLPIYQLIFSIG